MAVQQPDVLYAKKKHCSTRRPTTYHSGLFGWGIVIELIHKLMRKTNSSKTAADCGRERGHIITLAAAAPRHIQSHALAVFDAVCRVDKQ